MARSRQSPAERRRGPLAPVARALALLLFAWQALVVPAHVHAPARTVTVGAARLDLVATPPHGRPDEPADCPICREVAHAGAFLTPGGAQLAEPAPIAVTVVTPPAHAASKGRPTHSWRSRAPPVVGLA